MDQSVVPIHPGTEFAYAQQVCHVSYGDYRITFYGVLRFSAVSVAFPLFSSMIERFMLSQRSMACLDKMDNYAYRRD